MGMDPFKPYTPSQRPAPGPALRSRDEAEAVALKAIAFIAADEELRQRFVALTGCGADEIRARIGDPAFLGGVLDFILGDEPTLLAFAEAADLAPETPMAARSKLP
jgi:hypothetical protein